MRNLWAMGGGGLALLLLLATGAESCSRVLWGDNGQAVVVGRTMDWFAPMPMDWYALPRGLSREGMTGPMTLTWTAKYGSVVTESADGVNEKGLAGQVHWLAESDYGAFDPAKPGLSLALWLQFYLDNFACVQEAVTFTQKTPFQLATGTYQGKKATLHLALADVTGDSVIIEYIAGKPQLYHSKAHTVMTNSPTFDLHLKNLQRYQGFGGPTPLAEAPSADRFLHCTQCLKSLPAPADARACVDGILGVMRRVSQSTGSVTRWRTVADLTTRVYYYESATQPQLVWVKLTDLDFSPIAGVRKLVLNPAPAHVGDCTQRFQAAELFPLPKPDLP